MAIKAGRVGVAPSQVDMAGNITGAGSGYTKAEADAKFATKTEVSGKVPASQLQANSKDFYFAYDETSEKYGYKAGSDGDFVPFSSGGSGGNGWNRPAELITTGLTPSNCEIAEGGYYIDNGVCIIDICLKSTSDYETKKFSGLSIAPNYQIDCVYNSQNTDVYDNYFGGVNSYVKTNITIASDGSIQFNANNNTYVHIWGEVPVVV